MSRKAESAETLVLMLFELLVVVLVVWMVADKTMSYAKSDTVFKINLANDLAMMVNSIVAVPGDSVVAYPANVSKYTLILDSGSILVMKKGEMDFKKVIRRFNLPAGFVGEGVTEEKANICLQKAGRKVILNECSKMK